MKSMRVYSSGLLVCAVLLSFVVVGSAMGKEMHHMHKGKAAMEMHHLHILMTHGMSMIAEGSNMAMLAQMKMAPGVDQDMLQHGQLMMKEGKELITNALNGLYSAWAKANGQKRIQNYAFKCMSSVNGQALIPIFRGRQSTHFVATTKDLLSTGVNVP